MIGGFKHWEGIVFVLSLGVVISATYSLRTVKKLFSGASKERFKNTEDLRLSELVAASCLIIGILGFGFYPQPVLDLITPSINDLVQNITVDNVIEASTGGRDVR